MLAVFLAVGFAAGAVLKALDRPSFARSLTAIPWVTARAGRLLAKGVPVVEFGLAAMLLLSPATGALAAAGVLAVFTAVIASELMAGRRFDCGCFGASGSRPIGSHTIIRNLVLVAAAAGVVIAPAGPFELGHVLTGIAAGCMLILVETSVVVVTENAQA